jgi:vacuolar protein sorting-associated protein 13A/C
MTLSKSIPRIFADVSGNAPGIEGSKLQAADSYFPQDNGAVSLQPELRSSPSGGSRPWTTLDLVVGISAVKLHLYDENAVSEDHLKEHGIARFALNDNNLRLKQLSDGSLEAQVVLKSFTMSNVRPGPTKFREIIPAAQHERNQFMILYTSSGTQSTTGPNSLAILTIDSPQVIFAVDPIFALLQFFTSPFPSQHARNLQGPSGEVQAQPSSPPTLDFRVDLHDVSVSILENETDAQSRAIRLHVSQVLFSQQVWSTRLISVPSKCSPLMTQGIIALTVTRLGMSLMRMGRYSEVVRFLDNLDLTVSLDNRSSSSQQMSNIEINVKPVVLRASYRDINLITSIVNRAVELYSSSQQHSTVFPVSASDVSSPIVKPSPAGISVGSPGTGTLTQGKATVLMSKEQVRASSVL